MSDEMVTGTETGEETSTAAVTTQDESATQATDVQTEGQRFTQEDLNRHVKARLAKESRKFEERLDSVFDERLNQWRDENGITEEALETLDKRPAYEREISTYKGKVTSLEKKLKAAQDEAARVRSHLVGTAGRDAVVREALSQGSVDPESVFLHVSASGKLDVDQETFKPVIRDENGDPDPTTTIKDLVTKTLNARPNLAKPRGIPGAGSRPGNGDGAGAAKPKHAVGTPAWYRESIRARQAESD